MLIQKNKNEKFKSLSKRQIEKYNGILEGFKESEDGEYPYSYFMAISRFCEFVKESVEDEETLVQIIGELGLCEVFGWVLSLISDNNIRLNARKYLINKLLDFNFTRQEIERTLSDERLPMSGVFIL